jgi:hypothetical protein
MSNDWQDTGLHIFMIVTFFWPIILVIGIGAICIAPKWAKGFLAWVLGLYAAVLVMVFLI